jgi:cell division septal protein FtsQ
MKEIARERRSRGEAEASVHTRAEQRASDRRARALSHLQRVRHQTPAGHRWRRSVKGARPAAFALGALLGASLAGGASWLAGDAPIVAITVRGAHHLSAADVAVASGVPHGAAIAAVETGAVIERLEQHAWITEARALRLPTGLLLVGITEMRPAGRLFSAASEQSYLVDASGTPFAVAAEADGQLLPRVRIAAPIEPLKAHPGVAQALDLVDELMRLEMPRPVEVEVAADDDPAGLAVTLSGVDPRIVLGREDFERKLRNLARLLAGGPEGLAGATELDLRFARQAVLRNEPLPEEAAQAAAVRGDALPSI